jgi:hypothetical protein
VATRTGLCSAFVLALATVACGGGDDSSDGTPTGPSQPGTPTPTVRYVAPPPAGSDASNNCLDVNRPCQTPQRAHDVAQPGDTIEVKAGRYDGALVIFRPVLLKGESNRTTTLAGGITIRADLGGALRIENFSIRPGAGGTRTGIDVEQLRRSDSIRISYVDIAGFSYRGLDVTISQGSFIVEFSSITGIPGSSDDGVNVKGSAAGTASSNVGFDNVTVSGHGADGLQFAGFDARIIEVKNSLFQANGQAGLQVETMGSGRLVVSRSCVIESGQTAQQAGISVSGLRNAVVEVDTTNIVNNRSGGAEVDTGSTGSVVMRGNYWGKSNGPSVMTPGSGDSVSAGISFTPFAATLVPGTPCS